MQTVYDREVTLHSRNVQGRNALTERAGRAAVFYKPAHARKTQPGAWRRLAAVALCCGALLCAFRLYGRARSRFGVQLPVRTVLQNPELPNGCEAASLAALLKYKGVPADKLKASLEAWKQGKAAGKDAFGRADMPRNLDQAPFYAIMVTPAVHHTMGGVKIDPKTQVYNTKGQIIPGYFAAGEITGGVHGGNRLGGNAQADIVTFGRIAGQQAYIYSRQAK